MNSCYTKRITYSEFGTFHAPRNNNSVYCCSYGISPQTTQDILHPIQYNAFSKEVLSVLFKSRAPTNLVSEVVIKTVHYLLSSGPRTALKTIHKFLIVERGTIMFIKERLDLPQMVHCPKLSFHAL